MSWWDSSLTSQILRFLLFFISIGFASGLSDEQVCNPSSCGGLQIAYPFRLKGHPANCGRNTNYELTCSGNRTFLELESIEYFVMHIYYGNSTIQIVDVGLLRSNCSLPLKSVSPNSYFSFFEGSRYYQLYSWPPVSLMNCSKKIHFQGYQFFPCLSKNNSYVYAIAHEFVSDLLPSCSFLTMIPTYAYGSHPDLFQAIHDGFFLTWDIYEYPPTLSKIINSCLQDSSRIFKDNFKRRSFMSLIHAIFIGEKQFSVCMVYSPLDFGVSIAIIVVIETVQLFILSSSLTNFGATKHQRIP